MPAGYECHRTHARRRTGQAASLDRVLCPAVVKWWRTKSKRRAVIAMTLATAASGPMNWAAGQCRPVPMRLRAAATADGISSDRRHLHVKSLIGRTSTSLRSFSLSADVSAAAKRAWTGPTGVTPADSSCASADRCY